MATVFAGPGAARHLADFGADVVKVESPSGDGVRRMGWFPPEGGDSYTWKLLGRNKRAVVLDLKTDDGSEALLRLAETADVLVENFRPGTLERLGVGCRAPRLRATSPRFGHPVLGAPRHLPVRRREVGRDLDLRRIGRAPGADAPGSR